MIVGFQGEAGAFSEDAARSLCGNAIITRGFETFQALLTATASGAIDAALLPIENTIAGAVLEAVRAQDAFPMLRQADAIDYPIAQCLIGLPGATTVNLTTAYSHPVALAQCSGFFARHPHIRAAEAYDTAGAVRQVVDARRPEHAAIASSHAAAVYGAEVIEASIQDAAVNATRFLLLTLD